MGAFLEWVWARHHNILSWYVRPLFILPFCYFAYRRNIVGMVVTVLLLPTSLFWFPAPAQPDPRVTRYLAWEVEFLTRGDPTARAAFLVLVLLFFAALGAAFWKRDMRYGLAVLNAGTLLKVVWSVGFGGEVGWASLPPALATLAVCDAVVLLVMRRLEHRKGRDMRT